MCTLFISCAYWHFQSSWNKTWKTFSNQASAKAPTLRTICTRRTSLFTHRSRSTNEFTSNVYSFTTSIHFFNAHNRLEFHKRRKRTRKCMLYQHCRFFVFTYRFIKHTRHPIFIFGIWTVNKSIAQNMIVNTTITTHSIGWWTSEPFHSVFSLRTFC